VLDGQGRRQIEVALERRSGTSFYSSNYGLTRGRLYGHLLVLSMGFEVAALDTLRGSRDADKREVWRQDLSQALPGAARTRTYVRPVAVNNPWSGPTYVPRVQEGNPVGMLGPLNDQGVTFMRGRTLHCVDPIQGDAIWRRSDCTAGSSLFGDEKTIVVIPPNGRKARMFSAADGTEIGTATVPTADRRWTTCGAKMLTWDDVPGQMVLRLYDPVTDSDVWARKFVVGSKGWIIENSEVAVLEPEGRFVIIDLESGEDRVKATLEEEEALSGIYVLASSQHYILVTNTPVTQTDPETHISPAPSGYFSPLVNGRAYAFDRETGKSVWAEPVDIDRYGLPLQQSSELPTVVFLRQIRKTENGRSKGIATSMLCLDKRSGKVLYQSDDISTQTRAFEMVGNPDDRTISFQLPGKTLQLKFPNTPEAGAAAAEADESPEEGGVTSP
jgi:outer membrane protein assembly factor BamB